MQNHKIMLLCIINLVFLVNCIAQLNEVDANFERNLLFKLISAVRIDALSKGLTYRKLHKLMFF